MYIDINIPKKALLKQIYKFETILKQFCFKMCYTSSSTKTKEK